MRPILSVFLALFLLVSVLAACGQRGALYLPPKPGQPLKKAKAPPPAPPVGQGPTRPEYTPPTMPGAPGTLDHDATPSTVLGTP